ncbi:unnamed protein product [Rangifer tarandus platyrhynchus]|uniref:Uncharacterized protein n=2 Tax=Rangifer tarandus platyrhynchus TaxID=3082113 RepID=A0ACB0EDL9_RANTA|nr:unnamed protein product [Rangifer tarandus platyrhynchus]CAI9698753.1 unnamed protein product [Rangifer tarandus platyrhynchus]
MSPLPCRAGERPPVCTGAPPKRDCPAQKPAPASPSARGADGRRLASWLRRTLPKFISLSTPEHPGRRGLLRPTQTLTRVCLETCHPLSSAREGPRAGANGAEADAAQQRRGGGGAGFPETNTRVCSGAAPQTPVSPPPAETDRTEESGAPGLRGSWGGSRLCEMQETPTPVGGKDGPPLPGAPWADARSQEVAGTPEAQRAPTFARDCSIIF